MKWMQQEVMRLKGSVQRIEAEIQEVNVTLRDLLREFQQQRKE